MKKSEKDTIIQVKEREEIISEERLNKNKCSIKIGWLAAIKRLVVLHGTTKCNMHIRVH